MTITKNSFLLYTNYYDILKDLPENDLGKIFKAILMYQATGETFSLPQSTELAFRFIKNQLDIDSKKYEEFVEKQQTNGKKGGRPKKKKENPKNPSLFLKTQKSLNDNDNENENDNLSLNQNKNTSFCDERENNSVTEEDSKILENFVRKNKLANKNISAYVRKIISNGDHIKILKEEREKIKNKKLINYSSPSDKQIEKELASIYDKKSAFSVLARYYNALASYPPALEKIAEKYNLSTTKEMEEYQFELSKINSS